MLDIPYGTTDYIDVRTLLLVVLIGRQFVFENLEAVSQLRPSVLLQSLMHFSVSRVGRVVSVQVATTVAITRVLIDFMNCWPYNRRVRHIVDHDIGADSLTTSLCTSIRWVVPRLRYLFQVGHHRCHRLQSRVIVKLDTDWQIRV